MVRGALWVPGMLAVGAFMFSGCDGCKKTPPTTLGDAATSASSFAGGLSSEQAAKPIAKIGGKVITLGDFAQALADMPEYERLRFQALERRKELLKSMVDVYVLADEARRLGLDKDPLVAQEIRQVLVAFMRKKLLEGLPAPSELSDTEVRAYYDSHRELYREPERRRVAQIVVKDEATAKKAYEEAKSANATAWGAVVKKYSDDKPTGTEAPEMLGDIGFVTAPTDPRPETNPRITLELRTQTFALKAVNDVAAPFSDKLGFHVIRLLTKNDAREQSFADVERSIRIRILQEKRSAAEQAVLDEMKKTIKVEVDEAALAALATSLAEPSTSASTSASVSVSSSAAGSAASSAATSASAKPR